METWRFAFHSIMGHKLRSFLTMLGIIIGVSSVVVIVALGDGMRKQVIKAFSSDQEYISLTYNPDKGSDTDPVDRMEGVDEAVGGAPTSFAPPPTVREEEAQKLLTIKGIDGYYLTNSASGEFSYGKKQQKNVSITGASSTYLSVKKYKPLVGRFFTPKEYTTFNRMILLDSHLAKKLFGKLSSSLNKVVSVNDTLYRVIGVYKESKMGFDTISEGSAIITNAVMEMDFSKESSAQGTQVSIHVTDIREASRAGAQATEKLKQLLHLTEGGFEAFDLSKLIHDVNEQVGIMTTVVGSIAGISLFVGGVGVMNIMLVSVTERTREIGLRKALGATRKKILIQFLIESMLLTLLGGLIAIGFAFCIISLINLTPAAELLFGGGISISPITAFISLVCSAFVGVLFGSLPANKASKLNPIEALRYE